MTELEFEVLDELYFVIHFNDLKQAVGRANEELKSILISLWNRGWLRCYDGVDNELDQDNIDIENLFHNYHYLASKEGLMAHNTR